MSDLPQKNVFISHAHEDDAGVFRMKELLQEHGLAVRDGSITSDKFNNASDPHYIKYGILSPLIRWASTMLVLISPVTHQSDFVNWEIEHAAANGKRIVGVYAPGAKGSDLPEALKRVGDAAVVGWNGPRIVDAIEGRLTTWDDPEAAEANHAHLEPRAPMWQIERFPGGC